MKSLTKSLTRKLAVALGFAGMVVVNTLAMFGKINGINTADVSARYPTLFTPEPYAFSIWGTIYLLLLGVCNFSAVYPKNRPRTTTWRKSPSGLLLSCVANAGWIFAWHYQQIVVSAILMAGLMYCLGRILSLTADTGDTCCGLISLELPFGLYAGLDYRGDGRQYRGAG